MRAFTLLVAALVLLPSSSWAAGFWSYCDGVARTNIGNVGRGAMICWEFDDASDSGTITINSDMATVCFDPNITTEGAATAQVDLMYCPIYPGRAADRATCHKVTNAPLTGVTGAPGTQDACQRLPRGTYYVDVTTSAGGDDALVSFRGE